jgi:beta-glucosidase
MERSQNDRLTGSQMHRRFFRRSQITSRIAIACLMAGGTLSLAQGPYPFHGPQLDTEARITDRLSRMTLEEKIDALSTNPTVLRLGVVGTDPVEGLHGLALGGPGGWEGKNQTVIPTTTFPQARDRQRMPVLHTHYTIWVMRLNWLDV